MTIRPVGTPNNQAPIYFIYNLHPVLVQSWYRRVLTP